MDQPGTWNGAINWCSGRNVTSSCKAAHAGVSFASWLSAK
jgi:hypothetical protein